GHTLQPTALLHEAYLKIARSGQHLPDKDHFRAVAAKVMRQTLVDHARAKGAKKRGGDEDRVRVTLSGVASKSGLESVDIMVLSESLERLVQMNPRHAQVVEMKCFAGMTEAEIARVLSVTERTVRSDWRLARAWLLNHISEEERDR
ncbi:MAG: ECF-type sigma factor, partial [Phycisphaerales bacterium]